MCITLFCPWPLLPDYDLKCVMFYRGNEQQTTIFFFFLNLKLVNNNNNNNILFHPIIYKK